MKRLLSGLGESHLASIAERIKRKFDVHIDIDLPRIPTVKRSEVRATPIIVIRSRLVVRDSLRRSRLRVAPLEPDPYREDPLEFQWHIVGGVISRGFMPAVEKGVRQAMQEGLLPGNPMVDVRVEVYDGKEHPVDSKEIAFVAAANHAFKQAALDAQPTMMEPVYELEINVP